MPSLKEQLNTPWRIVYAEDQNETDLHGKPRVYKIVDCDGVTVVETDMGVYPPCAEVAEFIVQAVNEKVKRDAVS